MGWTFTQGASRADIIHDCTKPWDTGSATVKCLAKTTVGNNLWAVFEKTPKDGGEPERFIALFMLGSDAGYGWGYKDITEGMGPPQTSCPLSYLDMVPQVADAEWRERVRAHHSRTRQRLAVGQTLKLIDARIPHVVLTNIKPLRGEYEGVLYRVARKFIAPPDEQLAYRRELGLEPPAAPETPTPPPETETGEAATPPPPQTAFDFGGAVRQGASA
jgi:hypothetical protein